MDLSRLYGHWAGKLNDGVSERARIDSFSPPIVPLPSLVIFPSSDDT